VLNISTTRLILSRAAVDGPAAAGDVGAAFGRAVAATDLLVGAVVFAIIAIVQFGVISAGSPPGACPLTLQNDPSGE